MFPLGIKMILFNLLNYVL